MHTLLLIIEYKVKYNRNNLVYFHFGSTQDYNRHLHTALPTIQFPCVNIS